MREARVIMRRELKSYFLSPIAYVFGMLFLVVQVWLTAGTTLTQGGPAAMSGFFSLLPLVFLVFVPALTMRLWAEERKMGTLELLMTFPVRVSQLIAGKFLAALIYLAIVLLFTIGFPITLAVFGNLDWGPVIGGYLGALLLASAYLAVGMFWSSVTRDQLIALLLAIVTLGILVFWGTPLFWALTEGFLPQVVIDVLKAVSPYTYFFSIARGVIDTRDLVYYLCLSGFFLYANALVLQVRRHRG